MKSYISSAQENEKNWRAEATARALIEKRIGCPLDDATWKRMRQRLIEFVMTLERWDQQRKAAWMEGKQECRELNNKPAA